MTKDLNKTIARLKYAEVQRFEGLRRIVAVRDPDEIVVLREDSKPMEGQWPRVPSDVVVLGLDVQGSTATVVAADGRLLMSSGSNWMVIANLSGEGAVSNLVKCRAIESFRYDTERCLEAGDVIDMPFERAKELLKRGWVVPVEAA